jgi:CheY-like chemotaxis protein
VSDSALPLRPILLATDNAQDVYTFWAYHKQCGVKNPVEVVSDGDEVFRFVEGAHQNYPLPALLIASLNMPRMGGLQVLHHLAEIKKRDFPTVLLIDHKDHDLPLVAAAFKLRVRAFLHRPIMKKDFCYVISLFPNTVNTDGCPEPEYQADPRFVRRRSSR